MILKSLYTHMHTQVDVHKEKKGVHTTGLAHTCRNEWVSMLSVMVIMAVVKICEKMVVVVRWRGL